jgi:Transposase DDE domain/Domain of unknown function (DUF4372)
MTRQAHGLDSSVFLQPTQMNEAFGAQAMRYQSTVLGQLLKGISKPRFERLAETYCPGRNPRRLSPWGHLVAMVLAQAGGLASLREVERLVACQPSVAKQLGLGCVKRSTLSDANRDRPAELFCAVAAFLAERLSDQCLPHEALRLIDATRVLAGKRVEHWAPGGGIKLHVVYDACGGHPVCFAVTPERVNDIVAAHAMPIEPGATYVFDKGYYHFAFWAELDAWGCRFVTRLKRNSPVEVLEETPVAAEGELLFDRRVRLNERLKSTRVNPLSRPLRLIGVKLGEGCEMQLISNDLASEAATIAALYKARWQVELFFKWLKQNLKISHFLGTSRNAVTLQIMAALIAFLLLRLAQRGVNVRLSLQAMARLMRPLALARRPISDLIWPAPPPGTSPPHQPVGELTHA